MQVETDEHKRHVKELFWKYLKATNLIVNREFNISFDVNAFLENEKIRDTSSAVADRTFIDQ